MRQIDYIHDLDLLISRTNYVSHILGLVHMGSQVPLMLASPHMKVKSQLLNLKKPLKYGLFSSKSDLDLFL